MSESKGLRTLDVVAERERQLSVPFRDFVVQVIRIDQCADRWPGKVKLIRIWSCVKGVLRSPPQSGEESFPRNPSRIKFNWKRRNRWSGRIKKLISPRGYRRYSMEVGIRRRRRRLSLRCCCSAATSDCNDEEEWREWGGWTDDDEEHSFRESVSAKNNRDGELKLAPSG